MAQMPSASRRGRVLIVHDEFMACAAFARVLMFADERVLLTSAREAFTRLMAGEHFDVILFKLMMPEMNGMELHQQLALHRPSLVERIVFLSSGVVPSDARAFLGQMKNPCVEIPFDESEVRALVRALLER